MAEKMISIDEALQIVRNNAEVLGIESVGMPEATGRVLAEDVFSDVNMPPFNKSAMDGYACRKEDLSGSLKVLGEIPAGSFQTFTIGQGECVKIMTGAPVPESADVVIMKEYVEILDNDHIRYTKTSGSSNICLLGEDVQKGDKVLSAGTLIRPEHIAVLAGVGKTTVDVCRRPKVAVMTTGSELVEPTEKPSAGQIRNSNGPQMVAQLRSMNFPVEYSGIVEDTPEATQLAIQNALLENDVILLSGGVSVGDYDFVPQVLKELGFTILTTVMAAKPGKHTLFARKGKKHVLGLPGNPVSSYVQLEVIGKELLYNLMGTSFTPFRIKARLAVDFKRKKNNRYEFLPVIISPFGEVELLPYHGSAHIHALTGANALMEIPVGISEISKGESVYVRPL
ncbi:molybdopterin molybdotransferase MoeA [Prolixibacter denitrificans]|uniref:Molybdopterin molybdenumtransferase n=1 Tax=Prolixibacter denitrificans TaxID=1541063 RepID=A0A2P8CKW3_9BACT|nr:gephyrin-like molybdotransferase Glp [Prolixibacter denitrificans]PSK85610.1 molybdopterin molybdotransferase [Prolixibacter denitrificans]GET20230.1 molybdopterin molybdenumtransferase MoeA [Prolixibacter denitrificans]